MDEQELENRLSQLEEQVFSQQDNSKLDKKIGKVQTKLRELGEQGKELDSRIEEQERVIDRLNSEEDILDEVKSLKRSIERLKEDSEQSIENLSDKNLSKLEEYADNAENVKQQIESVIDTHEQVLNRYEEKTSQVHSEIAVAMEKADMCLNLQAFSLIETYVPNEYREELSKKIGECHRLPYERSATLTALVATWVSLCEGELEEHFDGDPTRSSELFEAFLVDRRLDYETDGIWSNVDSHMGDDEDVEDFIDTGAGQKIADNIWDVLGEPSMEMLDHDPDSHILRIHRGISDEKRQEAVEWFRSHYELQDRQEAINSLVERYFEEADKE